MRYLLDVVKACGLMLPLASSPAAGTDAGEDGFARLAALAGEWEADLPGFGQISDTIRVISKGTALEEVIGTPADNETSVYSRIDGGVLLTHFCALTPGGHIARLIASFGPAGQLNFAFSDATHLRDAAAPHMEQVRIDLLDAAHFTETWTKVEKGQITRFELRFHRRAGSGGA